MYYSFIHGIVNKFHKSEANVYLLRQEIYHFVPNKKVCDCSSTTLPCPRPNKFISHAALNSLNIYFNIITVPPTIIQTSSRVSVRIACHASCALDPSHYDLVFVTAADIYTEMQSSEPQNCSEWVTECKLAMAYIPKREILFSAQYSVWLWGQFLLPPKHKCKF